MSRCHRDTCSLALFKESMPTPGEEPWTKASGLSQAETLDLGLSDSETYMLSLHHLALYGVSS